MVEATTRDTLAWAPDDALAGVQPLSDRLSAAFLAFNGVLPLRREGEVLWVATWHETPDEQALDDLTLLLGGIPRLIHVVEGDLRPAIHRLYGREARTAEAVLAGLTSEGHTHGPAELALDDLMSLANEAPVVRLVNLLLLEALEARASDVHLESHEGGLAVRYRVDGVLQDAPSPPGHLMAAVVSRLKIMAELDIAERRVPQDGRIRLRLQDRQVDVRVSTVPTLHGESVVLRLLDKSRGRIQLAQLGMGSETLRQFGAVIDRPHGIVLATGPTGSGKTTTLYAALEQLRTGREKILTVEDPVEYELPGVAQVPVNERVGVTFATALRALLRQDPDVMLVGEIRDEETADIATHAALTGHLVLSTLHTNDAASALTRLRDLGVASYLVASTVEAILAQRLVRRVCGTCTRLREPTALELAALGVDRPALRQVSEGAGCADCRGTGYRGRVGIYELLVMSDEVRAAVLAGASARELLRVATGQGMHTLRDDGLRQVQAGATTVEEVGGIVTD